MIIKYAAAILCLIGLAYSQKSVHDPILTSSMDPSSFANVDVIQTVDFSLEMDVNFDN
jgi:hypothetical protein